MRCVDLIRNDLIVALHGRQDLGAGSIPATNVCRRYSGTE